MFGLFKKKPEVVTQPDDPSLIVPRIKHVNFLAAVRERVKNPDDLPVTEPLVADLLVTYAFDMPETFLMMRARDMQRLGLSAAQLRATAIANLKQRLGNMGREGEPPLMRMVTGNGLESCVLLMDDFWQKLAGQIPPEIVVGVPTRDLLYVSSSHSPTASSSCARRCRRRTRVTTRTG